MYETTILITSGVILLLFNFQFKSTIIDKYPETKHPINLMSYAVGFAIILSGVVIAVTSGSTPVATFFIVLPILLGYFVFYGIQHRQEITGKMRWTYAQLLITYSSVFATLGVMMFWTSPFMPHIVL